MCSPSCPDQLQFSSNLLFNGVSGCIFHTVKYADDLVLMAKEETVLQGLINKLIEIGRCYGMEMNVEKNKSNENFKTAIRSNNYDRSKTFGECGKF